jgi:hypothetical protein
MHNCNKRNIENQICSLFGWFITFLSGQRISEKDSLPNNQQWIILKIIIFLGF